MLWYADHGQLNGRAGDLLREADRQRLRQLARGGRGRRARRARRLLWPQPHPSAA
jgi:hypothetical protein